jgi:hypothetical protein
MVHQLIPTTKETAMASYTIVIPDEQETCITAARAAYNKDMPETVPSPDDPEGANRTRN